MVWLGWTDYMHPSNSGAWAVGICQVLLSIVRTFQRRLERERTGVSAAPQSSWITADDVSALVQSVRPLAFLGLFAPHPMVSWASSESICSVVAVRLCCVRVSEIRVCHALLGTALQYFVV